MGDPVTNFEVNSADPARARRFYSAVLGWKMNEVPNNYTFVDTDAGGKGIGGGIGHALGVRPCREVEDDLRLVPLEDRGQPVSADVHVVEAELLTVGARLDQVADPTTR